MVIVLALSSALVYGAADFCGGLASRRSAALAVVGGSQLAGLLALLLLLPVLGGSPTWTDAAWGAAAGLAGALGLAVFYRALAAGVMSVVAPVTAVCAAAVPVVVGLALGESLQLSSVLGTGLALAAVGLVAAEGGRPSLRAARSAGLGAALVAGTAFGVFFVLLDQPAEASGLWPLVPARAASLVLVLVAATALGTASGSWPRLASGSLPLVALAGVLDMAANALFLLATREGLLAIAGVLASLYPVSTVVLAQVVLRERLHRSQALGFVAAIGAVALIALP